MWTLNATLTITTVVPDFTGEENGEVKLWGASYTPRCGCTHKPTPFHGAAVSLNTFLYLSKKWRKFEQSLFTKNYLLPLFFFSIKMITYP